jgi:hypothetical protein
VRPERHFKPIENVAARAAKAIGKSYAHGGSSKAHGFGRFSGRRLTPTGLHYMRVDRDGTTRMSRIEAVSGTVNLF